MAMIMTPNFSSRFIIGTILGLIGGLVFAPRPGKKQGQY